MRKIHLISVVVLGLVLENGSVFATPESYKIDPVHSTIGFKIRHLAGKVTGRFGEVSGTIQIDPEHPENSSVDAVIQVGSIDTANVKRDGHLKSADFFNATEFPAMIFKSKKVTVIDKENADVLGDLTIHGVTKEVTLRVQFLGKAKGPDGTPQSGWEATTKINRTDFGLKWNKLVEGTAMVGEEVDIDLQIESDLAK
ncbi:MAG: YceI family protein [Verrucomicrobiota bacterium]